MRVVANKPFHFVLLTYSFLSLLDDWAGLWNKRSKKSDYVKLEKVVWKLILVLNSLLVAGHKSFEENFGIHFKRTHLYVDGLPYKKFFAENEALFLVISRACIRNETRNLQRVFRLGGGILPYIGYIGMYGAKGYGFLAVLVWNWVSISTTLVWKGECYVCIFFTLHIFDWQQGTSDVIR